MICTLQIPLQAPGSPGGRWGRGEEPYQQHHCREPEPGGRGPLVSSAAALSGRRGRRGILRAVWRSESRQHHGFRLGYFLVPLLFVPGQRDPLWKQRLCLFGQWKQVSKSRNELQATLSLSSFFLYVVHWREHRPPFHLSCCSSTVTHFT